MRWRLDISWEAWSTLLGEIVWLRLDSAENALRYAPLQLELTNMILLKYANLPGAYDGNVAGCAPDFDWFTSLPGARGVLTR